MAVKTQHRVCTLEDLPPGSRIIVDLAGVSVGVFNVGGELHAIRNSCPHKGAPLCEGTVGGTMVPSDPHRYVYGLEDRLLRCPWHGWEIDMATGESRLNQTGRRVRVYPVRVDDEHIVVEL